MKQTLTDTHAAPVRVVVFFSGWLLGAALAAPIIYSLKRLMPLFRAANSQQLRA